ncbi:hypothetical protein [Streptomyces sp. NPDC089919]|uniref:hypothetical protein n=1 Tax=Streptomyces sp. NPDC089919 TaxID=3155188 RepID=UPI003442B62C
MAGHGFRGRIRVPALGAAGLLGGALWWWAVLRLASAPPGRTGVLEGAVAVGGWGLSLLPVHAVPLGRAPGVSAARARGEGLLSGLWAGLSRLGRAAGRAITRAWRRRRSGGGSARS